MRIFSSWWEQGSKLIPCLAQKLDCNSTGWCACSFICYALKEVQYFSQYICGEVRNSETVSWANKSCSKLLMQIILLTIPHVYLIQKKGMIKKLKLQIIIIKPFCSSDLDSACHFNILWTHGNAGGTPECSFSMLLFIFIFFIMIDKALEQESWMAKWTKDELTTWIS